MPFSASMELWAGPVWSRPSPREPGVKHGLRGGVCGPSGLWFCQDEFTLAYYISHKLKNQREMRGFFENTIGGSNLTLLQKSLLSGASMSVTL